MAKRILALVMVLVLSLSVLSVSVVAFDYMEKLTATVSGNSITLSGYSVSGANSYRITVSCGNATVYNQVVTATTTTINSSYSGLHNVNVDAYDGPNGTGTRIGAGTTSCTVEKSSTNSGITVSSNGASGVTVSWASKSYINSYYVSYNYYNDKNVNTPGTATAKNSGTTCSTTLTVAYDKLISVTVREGDDKGPIVGTWYPGNTGTGSTPSTGTVQLNYSSGSWILSWAGLGTGATYAIYASNTSAPIANVISVAYCDVTSYIYAYYNSTITFTVVASTGATLGTATYTPGSYNNGSYNSNFKVELVGSNAVVSWNPAPNAYSYSVTYVQGSTSRTVDLAAAQTSFTAIYTSGLSILVQYRTTYNGALYTVGSATVTSNGYISYGTVSDGGYNPGGGSSSTANGTVKSYGCNLTVGATTTNVSWNAVSGAVRYRILYTDKDGNVRQANDTYTTSTTIPIGYNNCGAGFEVNVYPLSANGLMVGYNVLSATFTRKATSTGGSNSGTSTTKNLKLTEKDSKTTTVSWNAVDGAWAYEVWYGRLDGELSTQVPISGKTSLDIPLGRASSFQVVVYAYTNTRIVTVGSAFHVGGDPYNTTPSSSNDKNDGNNTTTDTTSVYVTGLKGTTGDKKVTLSWNAAKGATTYTVYWKRSTASSWNKAGSTSKRAANITGLNNGVAYDFKVVANDRDSGILTSLSPSASGTSTKTAPDPAGAGTTTSSVPVITSITGGNGTIILEWDAAKNAKAYQVWIAKSDSSSYAQSTDTYYYPNAKTSINGTTATITGLPAGTYKVRIKASTDGTTWYKLADAKCIKSDYKSVTVK